MAITYHSGRRIQGLEYTASTLTTSGFAGTWSKSPSDSQFEVSGGKLNFLENASSGGDRTWIDLGTDVSETKWLLRVRLRFTTIANQSAYPEIDFGISNNHANSDTDQDFIGCRILPMAANNLFRPRRCIAEKPRRGSSANPNPSPAWTTGKDYYIEFKRTSATDWSASLSDTNAYDGDIYSGSFTDATTSLNGLRYFTVMDGTTATSGDMEGYIDVFEFYNDTNTVIATSSGDEKPTNVQVGSRFEETDTRKMYNSITSVDTEDVYDEITGRTDVSVWITNSTPNWSNGEGRYIGLQIQNNAGGQALVGKGVKKIKVRLYRGTALTGTYRVGIMDSSGTVKGYSDHNASEVTGSSATYSHTMNNAVILAVGDIIFISYTATANDLYLRTNNITNGFGSSYNGAFSPRSITTGDTNWVTISGGDANRLWMMDFDFAPETDVSIPLIWKEIGT